MNINNQPIMGHAAFWPKRPLGDAPDPELPVSPEVLRRLAKRPKTKRTKLLNLRRVK